MKDTFDWKALRAEMEKHPIRSTYYVTTPPRHPPERIITGCTDGIEPWVIHERIAEIRLPSDSRVPKLATKLNIGD